MYYKFVLYIFILLAHLNGNVDSKKFVMAKTNTFGKPDWFDIVESEYEACRENVSLLDYSSFTKLDIQVSKFRFQILKCNLVINIIFKIMLTIICFCTMMYIT